MSKIIAPKYQHDIISKHLLKDNNILVDVSLLPLQAFINDLTNTSDNDYNNLLQKKLLELESDLKVLNYYISNQTFIKSIKDFHIDMYLYDINLDDLSDDSLKDQDLKLIFKSIYNMIPNEINKFNQIKDYLNNNRLNNVYLSKQPLYNNFLKEVYQLLLDNGGKLFEIDKLKLSNVKLYYTNNKRSEVEASAQMIIDKNLHNAQVILLNNDYIPLVEQIYNRYHIKHSLIKPSSNNSFYINFINTIKLIETKSELSLIDFLSSNPFNLNNIDSLIKLNGLFKFDLNSLLNYKYQPINDDILHKSNLDHYQNVSDKALIVINELKTILETIINYNNKQQLIESVFNYFLENQENESLRKVRSVIINNKEKLNTNDDVWPILNTLLLKESNNIVDIENVVVGDAKSHHYFNKENVIILGSSSNNYPIIDKNSGVIDEKYLSQLNYPKKQKRFNHQLLEQESILSGKNIYIFYPLSSYSGKAVEPSFTLIDFANKNNAKAKRYPLIENDTSEFKLYTLNKNLAKKLFFKDNMLHGSISAFEQYNNCNYAYFLRHGLKLYPKELPDLSYGYIGSVIHAVMEDIVNKMIDNKENINNNELIDIVDNLFKPIEILNPEDKKIVLIKHLLIKQLSDVLIHLDKVEHDTNFKPIVSEDQFSYTINNNIQLKGFVDRTDQYLDALRVIDFKSSNKSLSETKFKQGLQLQLITYLLVMSDKFKLKPAGAFYSTMRLDNSRISAATVKKTKDFYYPLTDEDIEAEYLKNNRLSGWHFIDPLGYYQSKNYTGGLRENKSGLAVHGGPKNFETVTTILYEIYQEIYDNIDAGIIDCVPIDNPCAFCDYHSICLSKTTTNSKEQLYKDVKLNKEIVNDVD